MTDSLVSIKNVSIGFPAGGEIIPVTRGVSFDISRGEVFALVGESGSGKTIISKSLLKLLPDTAQILTGDISFAGRDVNTLQGADLLAHRGGGCWYGVSGAVDIT